MKVTDNDILKLLNLKIGDEILINNESEAKVIGEKTIMLTEINMIISPKDLINRNIERLPKTNLKTIGMLKCKDLNCDNCPLKTLSCNVALITEHTLYDILESTKENLDKTSKELYPIYKNILDKKQ